MADAIVKVVDAPFGKRPFRVRIDPTQDGADVAFAVMDPVRTEMLHRVRLSQLLTAARAESRIVATHEKFKGAREHGIVGGQQQTGSTASGLADCSR